MLTRLADRLVLKPSTDPIVPQAAQRSTLRTPVGDCSLWTRRPDDRPGEILLLKVPGAGGRAERAIDHPVNFWEGARVEVRAVNPPGYGDSPGRARLANLRPVTEALVAAAFDGSDRPVYLAGNSLGGLAILLAGPLFPVAGLIVRNPPPLRQVIRARRGWTNGWVGADLVAGCVAGNLDAIAAAAANTAPAVFIRSLADRVVPADLQARIIAAYGGAKRVLDLPGADHDTALEPAQQRDLRKLLGWLREESKQVTK